MSHLELELEIQRCIDGQMPETAQQDLLRRLEAMPDGWRKLSLAFVESQVWSQIIQKGAAPAPVPSAKPAEEPRPRRRFSPALWGKVTASMAAGIVAGLMIHRQWPPGSVANPAGAVASASPTGPSSGSTQNPVRVPASLVGNRPGMPDILSDHARRELMDSGYVVDDGQLYYTIPMPDGRYYIVPVKTVRVRDGMQ